MMERIAAMAVTVHADGVSEAVYNGQRDRVVEAVREEMRRQRETMEAQIRAEKDRADLFAWSANRKRMGRLNSLRCTGRRRGPVGRALRAVENGWAMLWAVCHCWIEIGETLGLWVRIDDEQCDFEAAQ